MSKIALSPDDSGTGTFTLASPNSNTNRTLTLPDAAGELLTTTGDGSGLTGIVIPPVFNPVAVTGATPSLDVGTYNFFSQGTLTANTTVSFASVPTEARWSYSFDVGSARVADLFDVSTASYLQSFSVSAQDTNPSDCFFKPDGLKMYVLGAAGDDINEYDLSTAWDVSTAVYLQNFSVAGQDTEPFGLFFKPDGTKMYIAGFIGSDINEYDLSTAWDISTASFLQSFSVSAQDGNVFGVTFKPDGTKMYMIGQINSDVYEYDLSTAWDISTSVFLQSFSVTSEAAGCRGMTFKPDGLKMYVADAISEGVYEYDLSTAWDISTAVYLQSLIAATNTPDLFSVTFSTDGSIMYLLDGTNDNVVQYDVGTSGAVTLPASVENPPTVSGAVGETVTYDFYTLDGGTTVTLTNDTTSVVVSPDLGGVGTYVFAQFRGSPAFIQGQVISAATYALRPTNAFGNTGGTNLTSGSWRCMGIKANSFTNEEASTLFVRIS